MIIFTIISLYYLKTAGNNDKKIRKAWIFCIIGLAVDLYGIFAMFSGSLEVKNTAGYVVYGLLTAWDLSVLIRLILLKKRQALKNKVDSYSAKSKSLDSMFYQICKDNDILSMDTPEEIRTGLTILKSNTAFSKIAKTEENARKLFNAGKAETEKAEQKYDKMVQAQQQKKQEQLEAATDKRVKLWGQKMFDTINEILQTKEIQPLLHHDNAIEYILEKSPNECYYVLKSEKGKVYRYNKKANELKDGNFEYKIEEHLKVTDITHREAETVYRSVTVGGVTTGGLLEKPAQDFVHTKKTNTWGIVTKDLSLMPVDMTVGRVWYPDKKADRVKYTQGISDDKDPTEENCLNFNRMVVKKDGSYYFTGTKEWAQRVADFLNTFSYD